MKIYTLERKQIVNKKRDDVFGFFKNPENLEKLTPKSLGFRILTPKPIIMQKGTLIDYTIKLMGIPQRWTTLITEYEEPHRFVDEQVKGPYSFWHHEHRFNPHPEGTEIVDHVRYTIAFSPLGELANALFVKHQLKAIFDYREKVVSELF